MYTSILLLFASIALIIIDTSAAVLFAIIALIYYVFKFFVKKTYMGIALASFFAEKGLLNFDRMFTPHIIIFFYWIGLGTTVFVGFCMIIKEGPIGFIVILVGPLLIRVFCELTIITFKINESLHILNSKDSKQDSTDE